jgi:hypothetical protein
MEVTLGKLLAVAVAIITASIALIRHGIHTATIVFCLVLVVPLGLILFAEPLSDFVGPTSRGGYVNTPTPSWMLTAAGWLGLAALLFMLFFRGLEP